MLPQSHGRLGKGATADTFEQEFMMPPDITSIDSDISKYNPSFIGTMSNIWFSYRQNQRADPLL